MDNTEVINDFMELVKKTPNANLLSALSRKVAERTQEKPDPQHSEYIQKRNEVYGRLSNNEDFNYFINKEILPNCLPTDDESDKFELGEREKAEYVIAKFCRRILVRAIKAARRYNNAR